MVGEHIAVCVGGERRTQLSAGGAQADELARAKEVGKRLNYSQQLREKGGLRVASRSRGSMGSNIVLKPLHRSAPPVSVCVRSVTHMTELGGPTPTSDTDAIFSELILGRSWKSRPPVAITPTEYGSDL
jgi:hypothetical protein